MGFDKSLIRINGRYLVDIIGEQLEEVFGDIILATNSMGKIKGMKYRGVSDLLTGLGPLGGIYTALKASSSRYVFVTACDMPFVNLSYIKYMMELLNKEGGDGVVSCNTSYFEPLHAFYSVDMAGIMEREIENGNLKIFDALKKCSIRYVEDSIVQEFRREADMFANMNYYSDLALLEKIIVEGSEADGHYKTSQDFENFG